MRTGLIHVLILLLYLPVVAVAEPTVFRALADELERNMASLRLADEPPPYFVEYRVEEGKTFSVSATLGAVNQEDARRHRRGYVQVRVGDGNLDSGLVQRFSSSGSLLHRYFNPAGFDLPIEADYDGIRRAFWIATDLSFKRAIEDYAVRRADAEMVINRDQLPGYWPAPVVQTEDLGPELELDTRRARDLVASLSKVFLGYPRLQGSGVWVLAGMRRIHYLNSDGSRYYRTVPELSLGAVARTQASDGAMIWDYELFKARQWNALPSQADLTQAIQGLAQRVTEGSEAQRLDSFIGPVLFRGQAAAVIFARKFASQLQSIPRMVAAEPAVRSWVASLTQREMRFGKKIGARVLPRGSLLIDDPTLESWAGKQLLGSYKVDDESVLARRNVLVDDGRLRQILSIRTPMYGTTGVTGNNRGGFPMPGNLILESDEAVSAAQMSELLQELTIDAGSDYSIEISRIAVFEPAQRLQGVQSMGMFNRDGELPEVLVAHRVYRDGRRIRVRNIVVEQFSVREFRRLEALGDDPYVYTETPLFPSAGYFLTGVRGQFEPISYVIPGLLFDELSVTDAKGMERRLPLLESPLLAD